MKTERPRKSAPWFELEPTLSQERRKNIGASRLSNGVWAIRKCERTFCVLVRTSRNGGCSRLSIILLTNLLRSIHKWIKSISSYESNRKYIHLLEMLYYVSLFLDTIYHRGFVDEKRHIVIICKMVALDAKKVSIMELFLLGENSNKIVNLS